MNKQHLPIAFLGTVVSNVTPQEVVDEVLQIIKKAGDTSLPQYIATINVDFIVNANRLGWRRGRNTELLGILRQAHLATIDGMPIVWACRLLGAKVSQRVTGVDLFPVLLKELEKNKASIFVLGGQDKVLKLCKLFIQTEYPQLRIAGMTGPKIDCQGEFLEYSLEQDKLILEQIHSAQPDVLFINLGNPKQELWYNRVKAQLRVPVSIGIGGTIDLYTEVLPRAPGWMQKMGLEWLFRCIQEPRRLGGRYLKDLCLFPLLILPALVYHNLNKLGVKIPLYRSAPRSPTASRLFISATQTVSFSSLSAMDDRESLQTFKESLEDIFSQDGIVLDFDSVDHISLEGLALLVEISQRAWKEKKPLYFLNFKARLKLLAKVHRLDDVFSVHLCSSAEDLLKQFQQAGFGSTFYDSIQQGHQSIIISFFGQIDDQVDQKEYLRKLAPMMEKNCLVDLRYCTYIDQAGQGLLLNIQKKQKTQGRTFKLQHIPSSIKHKLMHTGIYDKLI